MGFATSATRRPQLVLRLSLGSLETSAHSTLSTAKTHSVEGHRSTPLLRDTVRVWWVPNARAARQNKTLPFRRRTIRHIRSSRSRGTLAGCTQQQEQEWVGPEPQ